jgi:dTDP-4-amino-4,6-dideoxygalactose transaminase
MGTLSFNGNKIITTSGGGALVSGDPEHAAKARFLASQAKENTLHFEHARLGYNYRMSNVLAGIGRGQMEVLDERVAAHRLNNRRYRELLAGVPGLVFQSEPDETYFSNFWLTSLLLTEPGAGFSAPRVTESLSRNNIDARPLMKPMHLQPLFKGQPAYLAGVSDYLFEHGLSLPSGSGLSGSDLERIAGIVLDSKIQP